MLAAGASIDLPIRYRKVGVLCEVLPRELQYGIHIVLYCIVCAGNRAVLVCPSVRSIGVYHIIDGSSTHRPRTRDTPHSGRSLPIPWDAAHGSGYNCFILTAGASPQS